MNIKDLKLFTAYYINEQDIFTNNEKIQLIKFIKESSNDQVIKFLLAEKISINKKSIDMIQIEAFIPKFSKHFSKVKTDVRTGNTVDSTINLAGATYDLMSFNNYYIQISNALQHGMPIAATAVAAMTILIARKAYKSYLNDAAKICRSKKGNAKNRCFKEYHIEATKKEIQALKEYIKMCSKSKTPSLCRAKIEMKINELQTKLQVISYKKIVR